MDKNFKRKTVRNTLFGIFGRGFIIVVNALLSVYLLSRLGKEVYGFWVFIMAFVGYLSIFNFGLGPAYVKHIAEHVARDDRDAVNTVYSLSLLAFLVSFTLLLPVSFLATDRILDFFSVPSEVERTARFVFRIIIISFFCGMLNGVYQSVINGLQRMEISNSIMMGIFTCYAVGCVVALETGWRIRGLAISQLVSMLAGLSLHAVFANKLCPGLRFRTRNVKEHLGKLFRYGVNMQVSRIANLINFQFDKLLINRVLGSTFVAYYGLGAQVLFAARSLALMVLSALMPATSELEVRKGTEALYVLYFRASKYVSIVAFAVFCGVFMAADTLIKLWIGDGFGSAVVVIRIACVGYLMNTIVGPVSPLVMGMGRTECQRNAEALSLLLNVVLSISLIHRIGFYGAPIGTAIAMGIGAIYFLQSFHRLMHRRVTGFVISCWMKPAVCALLAALIGRLVMEMPLPQIEMVRLRALIRVVMGGTVFGAVYLVTIIKCRYLDDSDLCLFREHISFFNKLFPSRN